MVTGGAIEARLNCCQNQAWHHPVITVRLFVHVWEYYRFAK